jgi:hypothetical protein
MWDLSQACIPNNQEAERSGVQSQSMLHSQTLSQNQSINKIFFSVFKYMSFFDYFFSFQISTIPL